MSTIYSIFKKSKQKGEKFTLKWTIIKVKLFEVLFIYLFLLFRAAPVAYGGFQARCPIRAIEAGLYHGHSRIRSEPCLQPTPQSQQRQILNPLSKARDQTRNLMVPSWIRLCCATMGTNRLFFYRLYAKPLPSLTLILDQFKSLPLPLRVACG